MLSDSDMRTAESLPLTLGTGERESIAVARNQNGILLSNESRVRHWCIRYNIPCINLPAILRGLWVESIFTPDEVQQLINELSVRDRMVFSARTLELIFAPDQ